MFSCFQTAIFEPGMSFFLRWAFPNHFFFIFVFSIVQLVDKILPLSGFELLISGVGSNRSTNWAATTARWIKNEFKHLITGDS